MSSVTTPPAKLSVATPTSSATFLNFGNETSDLKADSGIR